MVICAMAEETYTASATHPRAIYSSHIQWGQIM